MKRVSYGAAFFVLALSAFLLPSGVAAETLGMVADTANHSVVVFDADTDTRLGMVTLPSPGGSIGDCSVSRDRTLGFVTDFEGAIWLIDLTTSPPSLASGTNPILISNPGEDTALSPDGKFLAVCDGSLFAPVSVIDIDKRQEIQTFFLGSDCNSVEICDDGSVLVTSTIRSSLRRLLIDGNGNLTDTGESLFVRDPNNTACAPGGASGVVVGRTPDEILSFTVPGLHPAGLVVQPNPSFGIAAAFNPAGDRVFSRSNETGVKAFTYDAATGSLGASALFTIPVSVAPTFYGMDQLAIHPNGGKIYVSNNSFLNVYDAGTGAFLRSFLLHGFAVATGVCLSSGPIEVAIDIKPEGFPNSVNPRSRGVIPVAILTSSRQDGDPFDFDASTVDPQSVRFGNAMARHWSLEDVDGDGDLDLILHFPTQETGIACGTGAVSLSGRTFGGQEIQGSDTIQTVGCKTR